MEQEDKELLLKDLCSRLPYGVKCNAFLKQIDGSSKSIFGTFKGYNGWATVGNNLVDIETVRPYLCPMSSMTEKEKEEIALIRDRDFQSVRKWIHDESIKETGNICPITCGEIDYCNKKHFDYRGLIEKGLALEAPEGMYK